MWGKYSYNHDVLNLTLIAMNVSMDANVAKTLTELGDLVDNLLLLLSEKEKNVITKRFNINETKRHTLEEIGQSFSVTRERIRQIEKNALAKMKRNVFNTSLKHLHSYVSEILVASGGLIKENELFSLIDKSLPGDLKSDQNAAHLSIVLHDDIDCVGNTICFHPYLKLKDIPDYSIKFASNKLVNQLHKYGDVKSISRIHRDLKQTFDDIKFDEPKIRSLIKIDKRLTLLKDDLVGLLEWRHIHPKTLREKILYILRADKNPLHFTDIANKITDEKFDNRPINLQAVHNELIRHSQFVLIGRGIYALAEWGYESGTVIDVIQKILKDEKELSVEDIIDKVLKCRQIKRITILLALKNSDVFQRVGRKRYALKTV